MILLNLPKYIDYTIIIIFGLIIGSFLNVVILRFDDLKSILKTRSHCPHCKKELAWYDLAPFFSYVLLIGKCRNCKKEISIQYPLVEVGTAVIFALLFWKFGISVQFAFLMIISALLIIMLTYDILHMLISDFLVYLAIAIWIIYLVIDYFLLGHSRFLILNSLYGGLALGGFLGLLVLISREKWMGIGDIKLGLLLGLISAWPNVLLTAFLSFTLGSLISLPLIFSKKKNLKDKIPFTPFMILATFITIFYGDKIISWYLGRIGF